MGSIFVSIFIILAVSVSAQAKRYYCEVKGIEKELTSELKEVYTIWDGHE